MRVKLPGVRSLIAAAALFGAVVGLILTRVSSTSVNSKAAAIPVAPAADIAAVERLVPLSPSEEIVRTCGYQTVRVETTNRVAGYRTANYFTKTGPGQTW